MARSRFASWGLWAAIVVALCVTQAVIGASASGVRRVETTTGFKLFYLKPLVWQGDGVTVYLKGFEKMRKSAKARRDHDYLFPLFAYENRGSSLNCGKTSIIGPDRKPLIEGSHWRGSCHELGSLSSGEFSNAFLWPDRPAAGFAEITATLESSHQVNPDSVPYTIDELKQPRILPDGHSVIRLVDWAVVNRSPYVDLFNGERMAGIPNPHVVLRFLFVDANRNSSRSGNAVVHGARGEQVQGHGMSFSSVGAIRESTPYVGMALAWKPGEHTGFRVGQLDPTGPAAQAGIRIGDMVTSIDGIRVSPSEQFTNEWGKAVAGKAIPVEFTRDGKSLRVILTATADPDWVGMPDDMEASLKTMQAMVHGEGAEYSGGLIIPTTNTPPDFTPTKIKLKCPAMTKVTKTVTFSFKDIPVPAELWK